MRPYSNQSRTWIDDRMFSWYTYGGPAAGRRSFPMEDEEWNSAGRANQNGEQRPRKVTFIDPPFIAPEKKSSIQESFDNIKKMFGKLTGWISDSISDLSIRQTLQGVSLRQLFGKVAERFSTEKHHVEVLTPTSRTHSHVLRPDELPPRNTNSQLDFFVNVGSHGHPKRQRMSFVSNPMYGPNHISIMNHSRNSGGNQPEVLDQQTLTEWFIKCINSHEKNSDSKMSSQSKYSLERQVSQMLSGCFDKFGNFSNSPDDADYTVKDASYQQDDGDNNNNNNSNSSSCDNKKPDKIEEKSVSESGRPENKGHSHQSSSLSDPGRVAEDRSNMNQHDSCPLMCSLKEAEGKDVSELVKMFNSYAFLENNYDKNTLSEKYSNVNVKNTIKQLDLILFREREKIRGSRLYLAGSDNSRKVDDSSTNEGSTGKLLKSIEDNAVKGENAKFSQRPNTFRDMMRRAFRMKTNPSSVRNRSSTLPPNRAVKFTVPSQHQQQQQQQQQKNCVSSLTSLMSGKKTNNNSRNNFDTLNKQQQQQQQQQQVGNNKSPSNPDNVKDNKSKDKLDPLKQHRKNKTRSKSVLPQSISVPPWRRSRSKGCKNTEDSFNFLFQKLFADQPSFPSKEDGEFGRNPDMETHCSESLWNRIYAWELKERMEDLSKNNKRSGKAVESPGCSRRRFATRSVGEDNKNSSSSAMTVYHSKSTDTELSIHPNDEVNVGGKYPTIHRSTWHLHAKDQNLKLRNTRGTTAFKVTKGQRQQNCDMKSMSKSRLSINRKKLMFEGMKDQKPLALIKSLNKNDKKSEDSYSISSAHSLARRIVQTDKSSPVSEELNKLPKPIPRKLKKKELSLATQQRMKRLVCHVNSGVMMAFDEVIKQLKDTKIDGRECESNKNAKEWIAKKVYNPKVHNNLRRSSQDSTLGSSAPSRKACLGDTRGVQSLIKVFEGLPNKSDKLHEDSATLSQMKEEVEQN